MKKQLMMSGRGLCSFFAVLVLLFAGLHAFGQIPQDIPHPDDSEPLVLDNWPYIIAFLLLPLALILLYLWLMRKRRKEKEKQ